ncbi:hypothetical protein PENANT_c040G06120 [Penicillium antarcticum]|uniref:N-acetyltransferase domain-containing protein n=1 Tax=Penicillium antarcticum TaxID=416450 RepID=A0A1V6PSW1_9EURO|nr:uncharacterized protein N7508_000218 [Penicillium antarcticum]KAJ5319935.1 hypothetical protein N7508_000218 [Penicillium antarcticum]OQD80033.1 hypothetical protein PENANT_c040G06120 [Penicillium antarcticum]
MSDQSEYPSESIGSDNGLRPLSNVDDLSLGNPSNNDLSRIMNRAGIALANGFPLDDDEDEEDVDEDYVSVDQDDANDFPYWFRRPPTHHRTKLDELHPFVQLLSVSNVEDCITVENAFPEQERCSRDKFIYRLTRCPELSLGLFTLPLLGEGEPKPRPTLVGHIIATRTSEPLVTDSSMRLPANWQNERWSFENDQAVGHEEGGSTIAIHSLAVEPEHQGKQVGSTLMKSYIHRIREAQIADRIAIIAHDHLVPFYESFGFESRGPSKCQFGGGGWVDLILEFGPEPQE